MQIFSYDHINRLSDAAATGGRANYTGGFTYDQLGNIDSRVVDGTNWNYHYNAARPHAVSSISGGMTASFSYDTNGNMTSRIQSGSTYGQTFDIENRLSEVTKSGQTTQFFYDASGQRVLTIQPNDTPNDTYIYTPFADYEEQYTPAVPTAVAAPTIHANTLPTGLLISVVTLLLVVTWRMRRRGILWGLLLLTLLLSMGRKPLHAQQYIVTTRVHYSIAGQMVGVRVVEQSATGNAFVGTFYYTYTDHLGNVGALSDKNGNYTFGSLTLFRPFGDFRREPSTNPDITDRAFTGHKSNNTGSNDLGLIYMGARFYLPEAGRFISADTLVPDPMNPQNLNRYSYVRNSPITLFDPSGHYEQYGCEPNCNFEYG